MEKRAAGRCCRECAEQSEKDQNEKGANAERALAAANRELHCAACAQRFPWQARVTRGQRNNRLKKG